jgi:hypothetical protein
MNDLKKVRALCVIRNLFLQCTWYWGALSREEAERVLDSRPAGSFLLRDSASDRYIFTLSVRLVDRCVHARVPQHAGKFCLGGPNSLLKSESLVAFVEETVRRWGEEGNERGDCRIQVLRRALEFPHASQGRAGGRIRGVSQSSSRPTRALAVVEVSLSSRGETRVDERG